MSNWQSDCPASRRQPVSKLDAVVVGAGFSGLYMLHRLRNHLGLAVQVYEVAGGVGGTWYWNRYPGARCDSESYIYSYSFSEDLEQEWEWTERYPTQPEILRYLNHVADRFDLRRDILLNTGVTAAAFNEASNQWDIHTDDGGQVSASFLITAVGCLSATNVPNFEGLKTFAGDWYHTARWPHEGVDLSGKRVGIVGTGSTGVQAIPVIAQEAAHLTVFQRTPNFSVPAHNAPLAPEAQRQIKGNYSAIRRKARWSDGGFPYNRGEKSALEVSVGEREATYDSLWAEGGQKFLFGSFYDLLTNKAANDTAAEYIRSQIRRTVQDPTVAECLVPTGHPFGAKRPLIDTGYFETYNRENVSLVDVGTSPIQAVTPTGIRTADSDYELDVIVFATGFDAMTGALLDMNIRGGDGRELKKKWAEGPRTYLGLTIAGFPNLFTITGPGSPSVLANMPTAIEQHVEWISDCIDYLRYHDLSRIEATAEAEESWVAYIERKANRTVFPLAESWYLGANIPGKPRIFMVYAGSFGRYRQVCDNVADKGYEGFAMSLSFQGRVHGHPLVGHVY